MVIDNLKNAVRQEAAKAYLTRITTVELPEFEPGAELCDDSWMEYINEDCMTDASNPSYPTPFSSSGKIEEPLLQITNLQTEADPYCPASSPQIANPISPGKGMCKACHVVISSIASKVTGGDIYDALTPSIYMDSDRELGTSPSTTLLSHPPPLGC